MHVSARQVILCTYSKVIDEKYSQSVCSAVCYFAVNILLFFHNCTPFRNRSPVFMTPAPAPSKPFRRLRPRLRLRANRFSGPGSGSDSDQNVSAPAAPAPAPTPTKMCRLRRLRLRLLLRNPDHNPLSFRRTQQWWC